LTREATTNGSEIARAIPRRARERGHRRGGEKEIGMRFCVSRILDTNLLLLFIFPISLFSRE
jgi:hypothetical protein